MINGTQDDQYPAAGAVIGPNTLGTGILVSPQHVLTSASVTKTGTVSHFVIGTDVSYSAEEVLAVKSVHAHDGYDAASGLFDVVILELAGSASCAPMPLLMPDELQVSAGMPVTVIGYGAADASMGGSGVRRRASGTITMLESTAFGFSVHPAQTSFGDAGGPVVVQTAGGARIAGIIASTTAEERSIRVSALLSGFLAPLLSLAVGIDSVTVEPERPVAGYPFTVTTRLTRTTTQDTLLELRLIALENAAEFSVPLTQVIIPVGSDHMNVEVPGMVMGGHSYVVAARFGDSSMKSATFTARPHATIASMTVAPAVVAPLSQFTLTVVLAAPVAEPIVIPIDVTFPAGDMTTIAIPSNHTRPRPSSRPRSDPQPAS